MTRAASRSLNGTPGRRSLPGKYGVGTPPVLAIGAPPIGARSIVVGAAGRLIVGTLTVTVSPPSLPA